MSTLRQHWRGTALFALLSGADLALTWHLLSRPAAGFYEANGVAATVLDGYGFTGLALYKAVLVLLTASLVVLIARYRPAVARRLGAFACAAVGLVVLYSAILWGQTTLFAAAGALTVEQQGQSLDEIRDRRKVLCTALQHWERTLAAGHCTLSEAVTALSAVPEAQHTAACVAWYRTEGYSPLDGEEIAALLVHGALEALSRDASAAARTRGERLLAVYRNEYGAGLLGYIRNGLRHRPEASPEAIPVAARPAVRQPDPRFARAPSPCCQANHPHGRRRPHGFRFGHARRPAPFGGSPTWPRGRTARG